MADYTIRRWSGRLTHVKDVHEVRFEPGHVVFIRDTDDGPMVIIALKNDDVVQLVNDDSEMTAER